MASNILTWEFIENISRRNADINLGKVVNALRVKIYAFSYKVSTEYLRVSLNQLYLKKEEINMKS
jgi:hypothetical protein